MKKLLYLILIITIYSCANIGRPSGGPIDDIPPVFLKSTPTMGERNVQPTKIYLDFDENIKLDKVSEKVVVSPPQLNMPQITANGRRVTVELKDSLIPNTTYTIEFSDAIQDNNEGNPLNDFTYSFSTGEAIDTLKIKGRLLNAENLEPITGAYVGIQSDLSDSAFLKRPFIRVAKTNALGDFTINNIAPGSYRVYALKDVNNNYLFDLPTEDIAFYDSIVTPVVEVKIHADTLWKDSVNIDTIRVHEVPHYYPDDLILLAFNENKKQVYLEKNERLQKNKLSFYFSAPQDTLLSIEGLNFNADDFAVVESSVNKDTVTLWIKDTLISNIDTLQFVAKYQYTDTLSQLSVKLDTISSYMRARRQNQANEKKPKKREEEEVKDSIIFLTVKDDIKSMMDIGKRPTLIFDEPIVSFDKELVHLYQKVDTVLKPIDLNIVQKENNIREYVITARLRPGEQYQLDVDSAAFVGLYGNHNNKLSKSFSVKKVEEYSNVIVEVSGLKTPAFIEMLDSNDKVVATAPVVDGVAKIMRLNPGTYYMRMILDTNNNGKWDTGNYIEKRQPEEVRYFNQPLNLRANWNVKQEWDIEAVPLIKQKPLAITKNKPKEIERESDKLEREEQERNNSNNMNYGGGTISGN